MNENLKKKAAQKALEFVQDHMVVGLGTGSTTEFFIRNLIKKCQTSLEIKVVASSLRTQKIAKEGKLNLIDINEVDKIDLVVDGADQTDEKKRMVKGGGGALLREKILISIAKQIIIIVDETKYVPKLGKGKIPVEIIPYGYKFLQKKIEQLGFKNSLRKDSLNKKIFLTDNGNYILDLFFDSFLEDPQLLHHKLKILSGVVETGLFLDFNPKIIIGTNTIGTNEIGINII